MEGRLCRNLHSSVSCSVCVCGGECHGTLFSFRWEKCLHKFEVVLVGYSALAVATTNFVFKFTCVFGIHLELKEAFSRCREVKKEKVHDLGVNTVI